MTLGSKGLIAVGVLMVVLGVISIVLGFYPSWPHASVCGAVVLAGGMVVVALEQLVRHVDQLRESLKGSAGAS
jgi:hypothetical protein